MQLKHILLSVIPVCLSAQQPNFYVANQAAGSMDASSCANARSQADLNNAANFGTGPNQIPPGGKIHLCGQITTAMGINGGGAAGNPVTVVWEPGASVSIPNGRPFYLYGQSNLIFDGGSACGPGTNCSTTDTGTGIIELTQTGSPPLQFQTVNVVFDAINGSNVEVKNLIVRNLYQHNNSSDTTPNADIQTGMFYANPIGNNWHFHDITIHDVGTCFQLLEVGAAGYSVEIDHINCYNMNWCLGTSGSTPRILKFHDNHCHDTSKWDTPTDMYHHNGVYAYPNVSSATVEFDMYNNLFDGVWGNCCVTAMTFQTGARPNNWNLYNNVYWQSDGDAFGDGIITASSDNGEWSANTIRCGNSPFGDNNHGLYTSVVIGGKVNVRNNAILNCDTFLQLYGSSGLPGVVDNNLYMVKGSGSAPTWNYSSGMGTTVFASWQTLCGCDTHSIYSAATNYLNADGSPNVAAGFPVGMGANLTSLGITPLDSDSSRGGLRTPVARPATGGWDMGAIQSGGTPPPPTFPLTVVSGTGSGQYAAGQVVPIVANPAPPNEVFLNWTSSPDGIVLNPTAASTTLTMPMSAATVTASYITPSLTVDASPILKSGQTMQFTATVTASNAGVTWSLNPNIGTISTSGLYRAPTGTIPTTQVQVSACVGTVCSHPVTITVQ